MINQSPAYPQPVLCSVFSILNGLNLLAFSLLAVRLQLDYKKKVQIFSFISLSRCFPQAFGLKVQSPPLPVFVSSNRNITFLSLFLAQLSLSGVVVLMSTDDRVYTVWLKRELLCPPYINLDKARCISICLSQFGVKEFNCAKSPHLMGQTQFSICGVFSICGGLLTARLPAESVCCQMEAVSRVCGPTGVLATFTCVAVVGPLQHEESKVSLHSLCPLKTLPFDH